MRKLNDWIDSFLKYLENTEIPPIFAKWTAVSVIAAALKKKVHLRYGRLKTYCNFYIVLVGRPGCGKSLSISFGKDILSQILDIKIAADITSKRALIDDLAACTDVAYLPNGEEYKHSSLTVLTKEFEVFIGKKGQNEDMIMFLTDAFDCEELPYRYRTKHCGDTEIPSIFLNILGGTTPTSLSEVLPRSAIGGGFSTRLILVYFDGETQDVPIPEETLETRELREKLINDLFEISTLCGTYEFSESGKAFFNEWYMSERKEHICQDVAFSGWYERKHLFLLKLAIVLQASRSTSFMITEDVFIRANDFLKEVEQTMSLAFKNLGKNLFNEEVELILDILEKKKFVPEKELLNVVWRDLDGYKFDTIMETLKRRGLVSCHTSMKCRRVCHCGKFLDGVYWRYDGV